MAERKTRTREHVIASMSVHHLGYFVSKVGYAFDIPSNDYGHDGQITTFNDNGEIESAHVSVQLKATDNIKTVADGRISFSVDMRDVNFWNDDFFPVILVVFDAQTEKGYYLIIQEHFSLNPITAEQKTQATLTVHIDPAAIVDENAVRVWRDVKNRYREARA